MSKKGEGMSVNEFRQDLVSGDWVLISTARSKRPHDEDRKRLVQPEAECVFEPPRLKDVTPIRRYHKGLPIRRSEDWEGTWTTAVIPNKYPALQKGACGEPTRVGPHAIQAANGFHELVITRDHDRHFAQFTTEETAEVLTAYRDRYRDIATHECGDYISIFHNHGPAAGATVYHNHSQILSTPVIPPDVLRSVQGAQRYFQEHDTPVHQAMIDWEVQEQKRIVYENDEFIAFCPYVSMAGYEVRVYPKRQSAQFESTSDSGLHACADVLSTVLQKLSAALDDVDYNFYIHTAPVTKTPNVRYDFYHWHIEIIPRIPIWGGFELGTAISVNTFDPDECAQHLREVRGDE